MKRFNIVLSCDHSGCSEKIHIVGDINEFTDVFQFEVTALDKAREHGWTWPGDSTPDSLCYCPLHSTAARMIEDLGRRGSPPMPERM